MPERPEEHLLTRRALQRFLSRICGTPTSGVTFYGEPAAIARYVNESGRLPPEQRRRCQALLTLLPQAPSAVLYWSEKAQHAVLPPFPLGEEGALEGWSAAPLERLLSQELVLGIVLVRLGRYAVGVFQGDHLMASKTGIRYVHGRNRAGGSSQRRFERIREKQVQELFDKVCAAVGERFAPYETALDHLFLGGARETLRDLLKSCPYLQRLEARIHPRVLTVREPRHDALAQALEEAWASRVLSFGQATDSSLRSSTCLR